MTLLDARENFGYGASRADDAAARHPAGQWRQLRPRQLRELVMQLAVVVDTLGVSPPQWKEKKKDDDDDDDAEERDEERSKEKKKKKNATPTPYGGEWAEYETAVALEGACDGAIGAAFGVLNTLVQHKSTASSVVGMHPRFDDIASATTRAMSSRCSCVWATFTFLVNLAGKMTTQLMTAPAAKHTLRGVRAAVCNHWPVMRVEETPPPSFLPSAGEQEAPILRARGKSKKRRRKDIWKEKTRKDRKREREAEEKKERAKKKRAEKKEKADAANAAAAADAAAAANAAAESESDSDEEDDVEADIEEDPLSDPTSRLLLRATAASALTSMAKMQREWDDLDEDAFAGYDHTRLDAIDVHDETESAPPGGLRPWRAPTKDRAWLGITLTNEPPDALEREVIQRVEGWYLERGGDAAGYPTVSEARECERMIHAIETRHPEIMARRAPAIGLDVDVRRWWTCRRREAWAKENAEENAAAEKEDKNEKKKKKKKKKKRRAVWYETPADAAAAKAAAADDYYEMDETETETDGVFLLDPAVAPHAAWPPNQPRVGETPKGPLPGGVDPEGVLATVTLVDDLVSHLARWNVEEVGVAVEAAETMITHVDAKWMLTPEADTILPLLIGHIAFTATEIEEARANGGVVPRKPGKKEKENGGDDDDPDVVRDEDIVGCMYGVLGVSPGMSNFKVVYDHLVEEFGMDLESKKPFIRAHLRLIDSQVVALMFTDNPDVKFIDTNPIPEIEKRGSAGFHKFIATQAKQGAMAILKRQKRRRALAEGTPLEEKTDQEKDAEAKRKKKTDQEKDAEAKRKKKTKRKVRRKRSTMSSLCARNALLVHTLYSVTKEAEYANEGSGWPKLLRASEELLPAFTTLLRPVQSWGGGVRGGDKLIADVDENREMASGEMINEIGRNALIVLRGDGGPRELAREPRARFEVGVQRDRVAPVVDTDFDSRHGDSRSGSRMSPASSTSTASAKAKAKAMDFFSRAKARPWTPRPRCLRSLRQTRRTTTR